LLCFTSISLIFLSESFICPALASQSWERLDKQVKPQILQINVGVKIHIKNGPWIQLAGFSQKYHYPVFAISSNDKGFRIISYGTAIPIKTNSHTKTFVLTSRHVIENSEELIKECERFYAALKLLEETSTKNKTADAIWDAYENNLSVRVDPQRVLFKKYAAQTPLIYEIGYFLHKPGPITSPPLMPTIYKIGKASSDPDIAILAVPNQLPGIELDAQQPQEGQEIQAIGYPIASDRIDIDSSKYYTPTFSTGRVTRVGPRIFEVDAPITTGNSGGPVISLRGKVLGVVAMRALSAQGHELPNFGSAITASSIKNFAPELFAHIPGH
jgi:hypothetical protein